MKISIFGMGYVGCVTAACLIKQGHNIIGVDINESKIKKLNNGIWPIYEPGLDDLNDYNTIKNNFYVTNDEKDALEKSKVTLICVGTPGSVDGKVELKYLKNVLKNIFEYFKKNNKKQVILIRSTIPPGTTTKLVNENLKNHTFNNLSFGYLPEFLREGSSISDFFSPSIKIIGCDKNFSIEILDKIFPDVNGDWIKTSFENSESIKYISNSWHALKIVFTNEIAQILKKYNVDSEEALRIFTKDKKLNISKRYMRPGFAYGGSCLPKDLSAVIDLGARKKINTPLLDSINISNNEIIKQLEIIISDLGEKDIGFCGVSFKPNTDDLRNSSLMAVINNLLRTKISYKNSFKINIIDYPYVFKKLNDEKFESALLISDIDNFIEKSKVIVLGPLKIENKNLRKMIRLNRIIIDLKWYDLDDNIKSYDNYISFI